MTIFKNPAANLSRRGRNYPGNDQEISEKLQIFNKFGGGVLQTRFSMASVLHSRKWRFISREPRLGHPTGRLSSNRLWEPGVLKKSMPARLALILFAFTAHLWAKPFLIEIVDNDTRRSVPLMRVETVNNIVDYTDNTGIVTFDEPGLMEQEVWFSISGHGYEAKADGFGMRGVRVKATEGGRATVEVKRIDIAERIQRLTGSGRYIHGARLGMILPAEKPLLNAQVLGCDSVNSPIYQGKMFCLWGDTNRASYPLGNLHTTFATTPLPGEAGCKADGAIDYDYFKSDDGFVKGIAPFPGDGPTWLGAMVTLRDKTGTEHLVATYAKIKSPMTVTERGLCELDPAAKEFKKVLVFTNATRLFPDGHAVRDAKWLYFAQATPTVRMEDNYETWKNPALYQNVKCDAAFTDAISGNPFKAHNGSVSWNSWRKKWISIFTEEGGTSNLGEIRYAEAPAPEGPWRKCVKIVTHDHYSFYNPMQHPEFAEVDDRVIWFEGTYSTTFSGNTNPTPRYDYNQILYKLDLADPRLAEAEK